MTSSGWKTYREAWAWALYGPVGFYRTARPSDHFRTSVHASSLFADAVLELVRRLDLDAVTDVGAGGGELLEQLHALAPKLALTAVELGPRPARLPDAIRWQAEADDKITGLVVANELLDNIPCDVVEVDEAMVVRVVDVIPSTGEQRLGAPATDDQLGWLDRWWPLLEPGQRGEVGEPRDTLWASICSRIEDGEALAIDYGHLRENRPPTDTVTSYQRGRQTPVALDGTRDVTSHVAIDSVAAAVGGDIHTQRDVLRDLGLNGRRPALSMATEDPRGYVRALSLASQTAELTASPGLGDFCWLLTPSHPASDRPTSRG